MSIKYAQFMDSLRVEAKKKDIPFIGNIELTHSCNFRCKMCYVVNECGGHDLDTKQWNNLLKQATDCGMGEAYLSGGEPLVRKDFEDIYCKLYDRGVRIMVLTNGTLIDEKILEIFKKRPPEGISVTLYGNTNETYNCITGCSDGYDRVLKAINLMRKNSMPLSLKVPALNPLKGEYESIRNFADENNLRLTVGKYISPVRGTDTMQGDWRMNANDLYETVEIIERDGNFQYRPSNRTGKLDCNCGKGRFAICYDGRLVGCLSYTELYTKPLEVGFQNALIQLRDKINHQTQYCRECNSCEVREKCSLCPGINYAESQSLEICTDYRKSLAKKGIL